jgi:hypothetical protein
MEDMLMGAMLMFGTPPMFMQASGTMMMPGSA